jgi:hypothetical protein
MKPLVSYIPVSTSQQGRSGLGGATRRSRAVSLTLSCFEIAGGPSETDHCLPRRAERGSSIRERQKLQPLEHREAAGR